MASLKELEQALLRADAAGDTQAAQALAREISNFHSGPKAQGGLATIPRGFNTGVANLVGLPVDAANAVLSGVDRVAGTQLSGDMPVGGSRWLKKALRGFDAVPALSQTTYDKLEDLAPNDRKWAVGGEVLGASLIPAGVPLAYARTGATAPSLLRPAVELARTSPGQFAATEAGLALGSAQGGAIAESVAPGNDWARMGGEMIGGFLNPTQIVRGATNLGSRGVEAVSSTLSRGGRERAAARIVQDMVEKSGADRDTVIAALRADDPYSLSLTSGQLTGNAGLLGIEDKIGRSSPQFAAATEARVPAAFNTLQQEGRNVVRQGDPTDFSTAMRNRLDQTTTLARTRAKLAEEEAARARGQIGDVSRPEMAAAGVEARNVLDAAKQSARGRENELWSRVPRDTVVEPEGVLAARQKIRDRLLPNENMPQPVETFTGDLARQAGEEATGLLDASGKAFTREVKPQATTGDLLRLRSRALTQARDARAAGNFDLANQMETIAEGALDDLGRISDDARNYSRTLNQNFRQGFAGDALARDRTGGPRIEPERTLEQAFGGGGTLADVRMRQLGDAAEFGGQGGAMLTQQDRFLRGVAQNTIDQTTGRVNPTKLAQWQRENAALLERFPQLRADLGNAETAQRAFDRVEAITDKALRNANKTRLAKVANSDNPVATISNMIDDPARAANFTSLARAARNAGPEAVAGLRSATLESAFARATNEAGKFDFEKLATILTSKGPSNRDASLLELMRQNNVLDKAADERLRAIVTRAARLKDAVNKPAGMDKLVEEPDFLTNFVTRVVGANLGAKAGGGSGATLVAASAGSRLMRNFVERLPAAKIQDVLIEAAENPKFMAMLLEKPTTAKQTRELTRQINAFLIGSGVSAASDDLNERRPLEQSIDAYGY